MLLMDSVGQQFRAGTEGMLYHRIQAWGGLIWMAGCDTSAGDGVLVLEEPLLWDFSIRCLVSGLEWQKDQLGRDC